MNVFNNRNLNFKNSENGSTALIVVLCLIPIIIGILALTVDLNKTQTEYSKNAGGVDAAASSSAQYVQQFLINYSVTHPTATTVQWQSQAPNSTDLTNYAYNILTQNTKDDQSAATMIGPQTSKQISKNGVNPNAFTATYNPPTWNSTTSSENLATVAVHSCQTVGTPLASVANMGKSKLVCANQTASLICLDFKKTQILGCNGKIEPPTYTGPGTSQTCQFDCSAQQMACGDSGPNTCGANDNTCTPIGKIGGFGETHHTDPNHPDHAVNSGMEDALYRVTANIGRNTLSPTVAVALLDNLQVAYLPYGEGYDTYIYTLSTGQTVSANNYVDYQPGQLEDDYVPQLTVSNSPNNCDSCVKMATGSSTASLQAAVNAAEQNMSSWDNPTAVKNATQALTDATTASNNPALTFTPIPNNCYYPTGVCGPYFQPDGSSGATIVNTNGGFLIVANVSAWSPTTGTYPTYTITISKNICP